MKCRVCIQSPEVNEFHSLKSAFIGEQIWLLSPKEFVLKASIPAFCIQRMLRVQKAKPNFTEEYKSFMLVLSNGRLKLKACTRHIQGPSAVGQQLGVGEKEL